MRKGVPPLPAHQTFCIVACRNARSLYCHPLPRLIIETPSTSELWKTSLLFETIRKSPWSRGSFLVVCNYQQITNSVEQNGSWEATSSSASEIPWILWNPMINDHVSKSLPPIPFLSQIDPVQAPLHPVSWRFVLILSSISYFGLTLPTGPVTDYGAMAVMLWATFPSVPISSQWCTSVWTYSEIPAWQAICNRRRREASWYLQDRDTWHRFLLRRNTSLGVTVEQMLKCQWWPRGDLTCTIWYFCAAYAWMSQ